MGADATLVGMAYKAALAKKPGDWTNSFNKQYEGLIAAHRAQLGIITKGIDVLGGVVKGVKIRKAGDVEDIEKATGIDDIYKIGEEIDNFAKTTATDGIKGFENHYTNGGASNKGDFNAAEERMNVIKAELEIYSGKSFLSKKDKKKQSDLLKDAENFRDFLIKSKGLKRTVVEAYGKNWVDKDRTFDGDADKALFLKQVLDPNADWGEDALDIKTYWENGKKWYEYIPGRLKKEYEASLLARGEFNKGFAEYPAGKKPEYIKISEEELFAGIKYKHLDVENGSKDILVGMEEAVKNHSTFKGDGGAFSLEEITKDGFEQNFMNAEGGAREAIQDFASRGIYGRSYTEDLKKGITISTYEQLLGKTFMVGGVETDISTLDVNDDGEISDTEAATLHENDVAELHRILTNPKDDRETKFAVEEASNYLTDIARQEFKSKQTMANKKNKVKKEMEWERLGFSDYGKYLDRFPVDGITKEPTGVQKFPSLGTAGYTAGGDGAQKWLSPAIKQKAFNVFSVPQQDGTTFDGQHAYYVQVPGPFNMKFPNQKAPSKWYAYSSLDDYKKDEASGFKNEGDFRKGTYSQEDVLGFEAGVSGKTNVDIEKL